MAPNVLLPPNREFVVPNALVAAGAVGWPKTEVVAGAALAAGCPNADVVPPPPNAPVVPPNAPKPPGGFAPNAPPVLLVLALLKAPIRAVSCQPKGKYKGIAPKPPAFVLGAGVARPPNIGFTCAWPGCCWFGCWGCPKALVDPKALKYLTTRFLSQNGMAHHCWRHRQKQKAARTHWVAAVADFAGD